MNFSTVKIWTIPEGDVTKVVDSQGKTIWKKEETATGYGSLIINWDVAAEDLSSVFLRPITFADAASYSLINNYQKIGKGVNFNSDPDGYGTISFDNVSEIELTNAIDAMTNWGTDYIYVGSASAVSAANFQFVCAVETNQLIQALSLILEGSGDQSVQCYWEQGQSAYIKQLDGGFTASASSTSILIYDSYSFGWELVPEDSWITLSSTVGSGRKTVTLSITANTSTSSRTGTIYFNSLITGDTISTLTITQPGKSTPAPSVSVTPTQITFDKNGGTDFFTVNCTGSWKLTVTAAAINPDQTLMPTVSRTSGTGTAKITVTRAALPNADTASGNVYMWSISVTSNSEQVICDVIQDGALEL